MYSLKHGLFVLLAFVSCKTHHHTTTNKKPPFTIVKATVQEWVSGIKDGTRGTNFTLVTKKVNRKVYFKNVYYKKQVTGLSARPDSLTVYRGYFTQKNNVNRKLSGNIKDEASNLPFIDLPFSLNSNQAAIQYFYKGKLYFYKIDSLVQLPLLAYPAHKTNSN